MNTLYRKVLCSERFPDDTEYHDTDAGPAQCINGKWYWEDAIQIAVLHPEWWLEEVTIPADEEIEKIAESFANKKWYKYCDKIIGISHTEYDYKSGFKEALELLTGGKND